MQNIKLLQSTGPSSLDANAAFLSTSWITPYSVVGLNYLTNMTTTQTTEWPRQGAIDDNGDTIIIKKSITTPMQIFHGRGSQLHINIADSSNIVYNHIDPQQMLHVSMPVHLAQTFAQQGDASNHLRIAVHPTDPTVLSYYIENTQFKTQYRINDDERIIAAVVRLYIMPKENA